MKTTDDLKKLEGVWNMVRVEVEGKEMSPGTFTGSQIIVKDDRFSTNAMGAEYSGKMTIDTSKKPKTFDVNFTEGPHKGQASLGIYELKGDKWTICLGFAGNARPKSFATKPGGGQALEVLEREKPDARKKSAKATATKDAEAEVGTGPATELEGEWEMLECIREGLEVPKEYVKFGKRIVRGNLVTVTMAGQVMLKATFTMNGSAKPMTMDYVIANGPQQGAKQLGIYEWQGKDQKVCFGAVGKERPADYTVKGGDGRTLTRWKFLKK